MNLTFVIKDEYTYFASGSPLVTGAEVRLVNPNRGYSESRYTLNNTGMNLVLWSVSYFPVTSGEPDAKYVYSSLITNVRFICLTDVMNILYDIQNVVVLVLTAMDPLSSPSPALDAIVMAREMPASPLEGITKH
jgi:hypothetical protein